MKRIHAYLCDFGIKFRLLPAPVFLDNNLSWPKNPGLFILCFAFLTTVEVSVDGVNVDTNNALPGYNLVYG